MGARIGGVAALLALIGVFCIQPIIKFWRDQEIFKSLYKIAPPSNEHDTIEINLEEGVSNLKERAYFRPLNAKQKFLRSGVDEELTVLQDRAQAQYNSEMDLLNVIKQNRLA